MKLLLDIVTERWLLVKGLVVFDAFFNRHLTKLELWCIIRG